MGTANAHIERRRRIRFRHYDASIKAWERRLNSVDPEVALKEANWIFEQAKDHWSSVEKKASTIPGAYVVLTGLSAVILLFLPKPNISDIPQWFNILIAVLFLFGIASLIMAITLECKAVRISVTTPVTPLTVKMATRPRQKIKDDSDSKVRIATEVMTLASFWYLEGNRKTNYVSVAQVFFRNALYIITTIIIVNVVALPIFSKSESHQKSEGPAIQNTSTCDTTLATEGSVDFAEDLRNLIETCTDSICPNNLDVHEETQEGNEHFIPITK